MQPGDANFMDFQTKIVRVERKSEVVCFVLNALQFNLKSILYTLCLILLFGAILTKNIKIPLKLSRALFINRSN